MSMTEMTPKERVARHAAQLVEPGMRLGLGSGTTVNLIVTALGQRVANGELPDLHVVVASTSIEKAARAAGLQLTTLHEQPQLDLSIDGADEVDRHYNMIKGGGGAILRERIVLAAAAQRVIAIDETKLVQMLGERWPLPVEVVQFGWRVSEDSLRWLGLQPQLRMAESQPFVTDEGNYILDCRCGLIREPLEVIRELCSVPGIVAHGLFVGLADRVLVADDEHVWDL